MYHVLTEATNGIRGLMVYPSREAFESAPLPGHYKVLLTGIGYEEAVDLLIKMTPRARIEKALAAIAAGEDLTTTLNKVKVWCDHEGQLTEMVDELQQLLKDDDELRRLIIVTDALHVFHVVRALGNCIRDWAR